MQAAEIKSGMDIFLISQPPYKELVLLERDLELLEKIWNLIAEWETTYAAWKDGLFKDLKVCTSASTSRAGLAIDHCLQWHDHTSQFVSIMLLGA